MYTGDDGAAANIAAMPVRDRSGRVRQLLEVASLWKLEKALVAARRLNDANATAAIQQTWFLDAAHGIAQAIASAAALFQPGLAIIDGPFHDAFREQLLAAVRMELATSCPAGLVAPTVQAGSIGAHATVVGAARLSMSENFLPGWLFA